jgi:hypothetical protein
VKTRTNDDPRKTERWRRLAGFVRKWHQKPLGRDDGCPDDEVERAEERLGRPLPAALREWYRLVGRRPDVTDRRARSITPAELRERSGLLVVYADGPAAWGIRPGALRHDDPEVVLSLDGGKPVDVAPLSLFLLMMGLREAVLASPVRWFAEALGAPDAVKAARAAYPELPLPAWIDASGRAAFHGDSDTLLLVSDSDLRAIARTRGAWNRLEKAVKRKAKKLWRTFKDE